MRVFLLCAMLLLHSCTKTENAISNSPTPAASNTDGFVKYTIKAGTHYATQNKYQAADLTELNFTVRFDSTAVYKTFNAKNQYDINKLYGFADNNGQHRQYSARVGWRWSDGALRLFAYVYNKGKVVSQELRVIEIGAEVKCRIQVATNHYLFSCNETTVQLPRESATATGKGYLLYPYFGGDEAAPHDVHIWIRNEP